MEHNHRRERAHELLTRNHYRLLNAMGGTNFLLEFYAGPRGCVILQSWMDCDSITMYADWLLGNTWEEADAAIFKK